MRKAEPLEKGSGRRWSLNSIRPGGFLWGTGLTGEGSASLRIVPLEAALSQILA